jgi:hypothetical protein
VALVVARREIVSRIFDFGRRRILWKRCDYEDKKIDKALRVGTRTCIVPYVVSVQSVLVLSRLANIVAFALSRLFRVFRTRSPNL